MKPLEPFSIDLSGINLIEASAGTGKTYNIASLYVRALIERPLKVKDILVVTYTEAATKELRERLMMRLRESVMALQGRETKDDEFLKKLPGEIENKEEAIAKLREAIRTFDEAAVYTIHGFCYQALQEQAFQSRVLFDSELVGDDREVLGQVIDDYWRKWVEQISENQLRRPLLQLIMDKGYNPDALTDEFSGYIGKPYLKIRPQSLKQENIEERLEKVSEMYNALKSTWDSEKEDIFKLLDGENLKHYRTDWLEGWMMQMDNWIHAAAAPLELFDKFEKFTQSAVNDSLKKASEKKGIGPPEHSFFNLAETYKQLADTFGSYEVTFKLELFRHIRERLDAKKEELQQLSYDDLLIRLRNALQTGNSVNSLSENLRKSFPIALVDEFQDTDPIQYEIFNAIYGKGGDDAALFMIGDPKQAIYSFRGADIFAYLEAKRDAEESRTFSLARNFRSIPRLLEASNALFCSHSNPFILKDISFEPVLPGKTEEMYEYLTIGGDEPAPVEFCTLGFPESDLPVTKSVAQQQCAKDTALQIEALLTKAEKGEALIGDKKVEAADIAVLVRSHYQASLIRDALYEKNIKSVQYSQDSVFKSHEAEEMQFLLKALAEPVQEGYVRTALATTLMGYSADELLALENDENAWVNKLELFSKWHTVWQNQGFAVMFRKMLEEERMAEQIIGRTDGERKLTNVIHLSELLQQKEREGKSGTRSLIQWLARKRNEAPRELEEEQLRLESDENLVKVVTMHRSKGLEYPIVFCPFLWHSPEYSDNGNPIIYHDPENVSDVYLDFHGKDDPERDEKRFLTAKEDLAESVRLAYVAITRAKQKCIIHWVQSSKTECSPLGYLFLGEKESLGILKDIISSDATYKSKPPEIFEKALHSLAAGYPDLYSIAHHSGYGQQALRLEGNGEIKLERRLFDRKEPLTAGLSIASFSSLIKNKEVEFDVDYDAYFEESRLELESRQDLKNLSVFNFPKGPNPGTAIHRIFEQLDFTDLADLDDTVRDSLALSNIHEKWVPVAKNMIKATLDKNLTGGKSKLKLSSIEPDRQIPELEFYFKSGAVDLLDLLGIIRAEQKVPETIHGFSEGGFLKGFIDLTFRHQGKYYILDYKTNYLGDTVGDYRPEVLRDEMTEAMYDLQYHLYVLALHRYLKMKLRDYSYKENFGGVFYLFVRGINPKGDEGIYFDRPEEELVNKLDLYLKREKVHE